MMGSECDKCPLNGNKRIPPLKSIGDGERILFIGEAPVEDDVSANKLCSGKDGELFHKIVARYNLTNYAFTNTVMCYPGFGKKLKVKEQVFCTDFVNNFIESYNPDKIIALGKLAAKATLNKELGNTKIYNLRLGSPYTHKVLGIPVYVTYNPKAIYTRPSQIDNFISDLDFIFNPPVKIWIEPEVTTFNSLDSFVDWLAEQGHPRWFFEQPVALDFETTGLHPKKDRPLSISLSWNNDKSYVINLSEMSPEQVKDTLTYINEILSHSDNVIYHEANFDMQFFKEWCGEMPPLGWDTKLVNYIFNGNPKADRGLKYLARRELYAPIYNEFISFDGETDITSMMHYNGQDTAATRQLFTLQKKIITNNEAELAKHLYKLTGMLVDSELRGAAVNTDWLEKKRFELDSEIQELAIEFEQLGMNPNSSKQVCEYFGTATSGKAVLEKIENPLAEKILRYRGVGKELSTYVDGFSKHIFKGRVHTTYKVPGTKTGRLSSHSPNMQNLKFSDEDEDNYQLVVIPTDDKWQLIRYDYSQIEMRLMAIFSEDEHLMDIFLNDRDIHTELSVELFGEGFTQAQRRMAKSINFGIIYGEGAYGLSQALEISVPEAEKYLKTWYEMYPKVKDWQNNVQEEIRMFNVIHTPIFNRARKFELDFLITAEHALLRQGINFPIQSFACDVHLLAAYNIWKATDYKIYPVQLVHDELVYELDKTDEDTVDYIGWMMKKTAEDLTGNIIPFLVETKG